MKPQNTFLFLGIAVLLYCFPKNNASESLSPREDAVQVETTQHNLNSENMKLGAFSVSLNVKDIRASKAFYENLGFTVLGGDLEMNYLIMKNENALIGLFQGMFEGNILTFNPGWDENGENIEEFEDVREIQRHLKDKGVALDSEADPNTSGPANIILKDPDGNMIFLDQHR